MISLHFLSSSNFYVKNFSDNLEFANLNFQSNQNRNSVSWRLAVIFFFIFAEIHANKIENIILGSSSPASVSALFFLFVRENLPYEGQVERLLDGFSEFGFQPAENSLKQENSRLFTQFSWFYELNLESFQKEKKIMKVIELECNGKWIASPIF